MVTDLAGEKGGENHRQTTSHRLCNRSRPCLREETIAGSHELVDIIHESFDEEAHLLRVVARVLHDDPLKALQNLLVVAADHHQLGGEWELLQFL